MAPHGWPRRFLSPHVLVIGSQIAGPRQSRSEVQAELQLAPVQAYGAHDCIVAGLQVPAPSQIRASASVAPSLWQAGGAHCIPAA